MRWNLWATAAAACVAVTLFGQTARGCGGYESEPQVIMLLGSDVQKAHAAKEKLKVRGQAAVNEMIAYRDTLQKQRQKLEADANTEKDLVPVKRLNAAIDKLNAAIDEVASQRGAHVSGLYWYTDLNEAKAVAKQANKPILTLRMLGKLTDECSCANSRFFRTVLYANREISDYLRDHYILHWQSVRPVPTVTVDFGDGRKLVRTVTGNSIHYVLGSNGKLIDGLPGLYGPAPFLGWAKEMEAHAKDAATVSPENAAHLSREFHARELESIKRRWATDLERVAPEVAKQVVQYIPIVHATQQPTATAARQVNTTTQAPQQSAAAAPATAVPAELAAGRAGAKTAVEAAVLTHLVVDPAQLDRVTSDDSWKQIAALHAADAKLDSASIDVMRRENPPTAKEAARRALSKSRVEDPIVRLVRQFESSIALDTVRNEYLLHRALHEWFIAGNAPADLEALNERVYAELFLTPSSDPWLGLAPANTYTGLERNGVVETQPVRKQ